MSAKAQGSDCNGNHHSAKAAAAPSSIAQSPSDPDPFASVLSTAKYALSLLRGSPRNYKSRRMQQRDAVLAALAVYLFGFVSSAGFGLKAAVWLALWYFTGGNEWCRLFAKTWKRDGL